MRPQYFPWLFDDRSAWEKSLSDPRYTYELPMDCFMTLYQLERKEGVQETGGFQQYFPTAVAAATVMPIMPAVAAPNNASPLSVPLASVSMDAAQPAAAKSGESKIEEGILSQEEIDALLSGV